MRLGRWGFAARIAKVAAAGATAVAVVAGPIATAGAAATADAAGRHGRSYEPRERAGATPPSRFVAEYDGRLAVVSAETGRRERYLTAVNGRGDASYPAVSPDGRVVWFSRGDGSCAAHLASVPVGGGREEAVPGSGEIGPETVPLPRPNRAQLAFARIDCDRRDAALVVGDLDGLEARGRSGLIPLAWSRDGDLLLAQTVRGDETRLLHITPAGGIESATPLRLKDPVADCRLEVVGFSPDENDGYVAFRRCGPSGDRGRRSLVLLHRDGNLRKTVLRLSRGQDFADHPVFDRTGHSLLYFTVPADRAAQAGSGRGDQRPSLWLWRDGDTRRLQRHASFSHPAWLP